MIGIVIRELRIKKGLTLFELSERAKTTISNIHNIETGKNQNPGWYTIINIANALDVDIIELKRMDDLLLQIDNPRRY